MHQPQQVQFQVQAPLKRLSDVLLTVQQGQIKLRSRSGSEPSRCLWNSSFLSHREHTQPLSLGPVHHEALQEPVVTHTSTFCGNPLLFLSHGPFSMCLTLKHSLKPEPTVPPQISLTKYTLFSSARCWCVYVCASQIYTIFLCLHVHWQLFESVYAY